MKHYRFIILIPILYSVTYVAFAAYTPLTNGIPGVTEGGGLVSYINALFKLLISASVLIAVVKIAVSGIRYMISEAGVSTKAKALEDIWASLIGLAIILSAVLILNIINPCIVNLDIFSSHSTECKGV